MKIHSFGTENVMILDGFGLGTPDPGETRENDVAL